MRQARRAAAYPAFGPCLRDGAPTARASAPAGPQSCLLAWLRSVCPRWSWVAMANAVFFLFPGLENTYIRHSSTPFFEMTLVRFMKVGRS